MKFLSSSFISCLYSETELTNTDVYFCLSQIMMQTKKAHIANDMSEKKVYSISD